MANRRQPFVAGQFYPARENDCRRELEQYTQYNSESAEPDGAPCVGIVPHAGWVFSGPTAGKVFRFIKDRITPETFILLGAAHRAFSRQPVLYPDGAWDTPLGPVAVDGQIASALADTSETPVLCDPALHDGEHSIEVQAPFIKFLFPDARIVPVLVPPGDTAATFGNAVGRVLEQNPGRVAVVASTDLTHYGHQYGFAPKGEGEEAHRWAKQVNDQRFIDAALSLDGNQILEDAVQYRNACGAGAAAAAVTAAKHVGARGGLLEHVTSHEVMPRGRPSMFVGYAGIVFCI
jgi:hypothetical protein